MVWETTYAMNKGSIPNLSFFLDPAMPMKIGLLTNISKFIEFLLDGCP